MEQSKSVHWPIAVGYANCRRSFANCWAVARCVPMCAHHSDQPGGAGAVSIGLRRRHNEETYIVIADFPEA